MPVHGWWTVPERIVCKLASNANGIVPVVGSSAGSSAGFVADSTTRVDQSGDESPHNTASIRFTRRGPQRPSTGIDVHVACLLWGAPEMDDPQPESSPEILARSTNTTRASENTTYRVRAQARRAGLSPCIKNDTVSTGKSFSVVIRSVSSWCGVRACASGSLRIEATRL